MSAGSDVSGVVLAAGPSTRFHANRPKQLIEFDGIPLVRRIAEQALASRLRELIVVIGHHGDAVRAALAGLDLRIANNGDSSGGQSSSLRCGLDAIDPDAAAVLFMVCDQPLLTATVLDRLIRAFESSGGPIVEPVCRGRRGSPVLFARPLFAELRSITGDTGGRAILPSHADDIVQVELDDDRPLRDIDTAGDLSRLLD